MTAAKFNALRTALGLSFADCAKLTGYTTSGVKSWGTGRAQPWPPFVAWMERQVAARSADPAPRRPVNPEVNSAAKGANP